MGSPQRQARPFRPDTRPGWRVAVSEALAPMILLLVLGLLAEGLWLAINTVGKLGWT
jgi:hypothetical protein